jgi:ArsR family transcriptional regulator, arsenate/arsenite/antimonite-responsive transcriptional repressor
MNIVDLFRLNIPLFTALGDIRRQDIILLLAEEKLASVSWIAGRMSISRPAVSHHLKILHAAGLLAVKRQGRERLYYLDLLPNAARLKQLIEAIEKCQREKKQSKT